jgi:outer membrane lipoprotein-sorting protein
MNRRNMIRILAAQTVAATVLAGLSFGMAQADQRTLVEVSKYLNQLRSVTGRFRQANPDGSRAAGTYWLKRPGLARFEYDGRTAMVIADGINVGVFDAKSNQGVQKYPLSRSPLRLLLREEIDLTAEGVALGTENDGAETTIRLQDPRRPRDGTMTLVLSNRPPALKRWIAVDPQGEQTVVVLDSIERVSGVPRAMFAIEREETLWREGR